MKELITDKLDTMEENENDPVFEQKTGSEKNLIVPILVVIILTGLAVWLVPGDDTDDAKKPLPKLDSVIQPLDTSLPVIRPLDDEGNTVSEDASDTAGQDADSQPDGAISRPDATDDGADVRSLITQLREDGDDSGQKAFEEAEMRRKMGDNENAYLLYFFAAKRGHALAAMVLGTMADPIYYTSVTSALDAPDPAQAIKWYKIAIAAGDNGAKQKLADLARRIKQQAEDGSSEAQRLMLQLR